MPSLIDTDVKLVKKKSKKKRKGAKTVEVKRQEMFTGFADIVSVMERKIDTIKADRSKRIGVRFFRDLIRDVNKLKRQSVGMMKSKRTTTTGFNKPVEISKEMSKFGKWNIGTKVSRAEVTRYIAKYIRKHKLYNEKDKREFIPDSKLARLVGYDKRTETEPLNYWKLQTRIQHHYIKNSKKN